MNISGSAGAGAQFLAHAPHCLSGEKLATIRFEIRTLQFIQFVNARTRIYSIIMGLWFRIIHY